MKNAANKLLCFILFTKLLVADALIFSVFINHHMACSYVWSNKVVDNGQNNCIYTRWVSKARKRPWRMIDDNKLKKKIQVKQGYEVDVTLSIIKWDCLHRKYTQRYTTVITDDWNKGCRMNDTVRLIIDKLYSLLCKHLATHQNKKLKEEGWLSKLMYIYICIICNFTLCCLLFIRA